MHGLTLEWLPSNVLKGQLDQFILKHSILELVMSNKFHHILTDQPVLPLKELNTLKVLISMVLLLVNCSMLWYVKQENYHFSLKESLILSCCSH